MPIACEQSAVDPERMGEGVDPGATDDIADALGKAMHAAQVPWREAPVDELDAELLALIDARAGGDPEERAQMIASAKRYPAVREAIRNPSRYSVLSASSSPVLSRAEG